MTGSTESSSMGFQTGCTKVKTHARTHTHTPDNLAASKSGLRELASAVRTYFPRGC